MKKGAHTPLLVDTSFEVTLLTPHWPELNHVATSSRLGMQPLVSVAIYLTEYRVSFTKEDLTGHENQVLAMIPSLILQSSPLGPQP